MEWSDIALPLGNPDQPGFGFHLNYHLPVATCDIPATERQVEAVKLFYQVDFGDLRDSQAHALLSCREYARLCADSLFKQYPYAVRASMARALAAFILADNGMVQFAVHWSDRNFAHGLGSPRVRGTPYYLDVQQFATYLEGMIEISK